MKRRIFKSLLWTISALLLVSVAAPFLPAHVLHGAIERALQRGLGRQVEIEDVHFTFFPGVFPGPGFSLDGVTIHEDSRAGIEAFARVETLGARIRLFSLLRRRLDFSDLNLEDARINLVKTDDGPWNFQFLLDSPAANAGTMPAIRMRAGRVNFKFGDTKSLLCFNDANLNLTPFKDGSVELRFDGEPSRTDHAAQEFGRFFVHGNAAPGNKLLDFTIELQKSALEETLRLVDPTAFGVHGVVALTAEISGPPSRLEVNGQMQVDDFYGADLPPTQGVGWKLPYQGTLDLPNERLDLQATTGVANSPVVVRFRSWDFLRLPHWDAGADLQQAPLAALLEIGKHMGQSLPEDLAAEGLVSGSVTYNQHDGLKGSLALRDASLTLPDAEPLKAALAAIDIGEGSIRLHPATVHIGERQTADIEGSYTLLSPRELNVTVSSRGLSVANLRSYGLGGLPVVAAIERGTWRGSAHFADGEWYGDSELQDTRLTLDGLADPLVIHSAALNLIGKRVALSKIKASVGKLDLSGDYRAESGSTRPARVNVAFDEVDGSELQRVLAPTLIRERGFLVRTLGVGSEPPAPGWLKARRVEGTVSFSSLEAGDLKFRNLKSRLGWDGTMIRLSGITGLLDPSSISGDLTLDLSGAAPRFHTEGKLADLPYKSGKLEFNGSMDAEGMGIQLLETAKAEGQLRGRAIAFTNEAEFRTLNAAFEMQGIGALSRWKLSNVEVEQGPESWVGIGSSQPDGRLVLDLINKGRQTRYTGALFAMSPAQ